MTGAWFDLRRRALGLLVSETAIVCGNVRERTVNRWINDHSPVPADAIEALETLEEKMDASVDRLVKIACDMTDAGPLELRVYRTQEDLSASLDDIGIPLGAHAMMTAWLDAALAAEGIDTRVLWADMVD